MNRKYIVFSEEHYNPLGLIRSLGKKGIKVIAIILKKDYKLASKSKYISELYNVDTIDAGYELLINKFSNEKEKPFLYTCDDTITCYLDNRYNELKDKFYFFNSGKNNRIEYFMNKSNINNLAKKHGLSVAKSWEVIPGTIPDDIEYPVVTKAIISTIDHWKDDAFVCNNECELKEAFKKIKSKKILIQKFIDKKNELCFDGFSVDRGKKVLYSIATNYLSLKNNAYSNYMIVQESSNKELEIKLSNMFKEIGFEGIFSIEFLIDKNDNYYFLEINFRNSTWSYASTKAGMNLPLLWSECMIDTEKIKNCKKTFKPFKAIVEFVDYSDRVKTREIGKLKWFIQLLGCRCWYFIDICDMKPIFYKIGKKLRRRD